jgi:NMD protein affecting ribosome stability and mRNA decay
MFDKICSQCGEKAGKSSVPNIADVCPDCIDKIFEEEAIDEL